MGSQHHRHSRWLQTLFTEKRKSKGSPTLCEQCYSQQPDPSQTRARRPPCLTLSYPAISGQSSGHPVKMSTGSAVDPAAALLLVVARRGDRSQVFSGNASAAIGWDLKRAYFAYSMGSQCVINSPEELWLMVLLFLWQKSKSLRSPFIESVCLKSAQCARSVYSQRNIY